MFFICFWGLLCARPDTARQYEVVAEAVVEKLWTPPNQHHNLQLSVVGPRIPRICCLDRFHALVYRFVVGYEKRPYGARRPMDERTNLGSLVL